MTMKTLANSGCNTAKLRQNKKVIFSRVSISNFCQIKTAPLRRSLAPQDSGLEISIRNRYRYSLLFRYRMRKFFTFFHDWLGLFPTFLRGKSILINRYFFLNKFFQKVLFFVIFSTLSGFCGVCRYR